MSNTSTLSVPTSDVDQLMLKVADEAGLELNMELPQAGSVQVGASTQVLSTVTVFIFSSGHLPTVLCL